MGYTAHITPAEWRWVIFVSAVLVLIAFAPFVLMALSSEPGTDWQFMGVLHNYRDGATYLSKMTLGTEGQWMVFFQHTPDQHNGAFIQILYPLLGQIAGFASVPVIVLFHVARVVAAMFMYMALYYLAASIWMRLRTRRLFFILIAIGAGFGWLYAFTSGGAVDTPDLSIPEVFPFYSSLVNVHFPLTLACLALLASVIISVFRPGSTEEPNLNNGGSTAALSSLALSFLYPQALVPFGAALAVYVLIRWIGERRLTLRELRWLLVVGLPALPMAAYYGGIIIYNPAVAEWNSQNITSAPSPLALVLGLGIPLLMALPGIIRAIRRFEADGDQFMLIWLLVMLIAIYIPTNVQRRFAVGMMIPVIYFATRSLEDFWFQHVNRRWRYRLFMLVIPIVALTNVFVLFTPLLPLVASRPEESRGLFLERSYASAFEWLRPRTRLTDVVLAAPDVSIWLPAWASARVVYGHPYETLEADIKEQHVLDWYDSGSSGDCAKLLEDYNVKYVIYGPEERALGETNCIDSMTPAASIGDVTIYAP
jgi:hypothetical protein